MRSMSEFGKGGEIFKKPEKWVEYFMRIILYYFNMVFIDSAPKNIIFSRDNRTNQTLYRSMPSKMLP